MIQTLDTDAELWALYRDCHFFARKFLRRCSEVMEPVLDKMGVITIPVREQI